MVNKEKIEKLFSDLNDYLKSLSKLRNLPETDYFNDYRNVFAGRYLLQISIETCINIANHIISANKLGLPKEYADTFRILAQHKIITEELKDRLILMTRFRNRLVHLYWDIDDKFVKKIIEKDTEDFKLFKKSISVFLGDE